MMCLIKRILTLFLIIGFSSCSNEPLEMNQNILEPLAYREILNVPYGTNASQVYDIYLPENRDTNTKVMILIHGGSWVSGDKSDMNALIDLYRQNLPEIAIVNINYRLSDQNNPAFPMQIDDITSVINDLKANKANYVISSNYGLLGTSAGGHLALLWSYAFDTEKIINMVASIVGPTNFTDPAYLNNSNPFIQLLLNSYSINTSAEFLEEISPLHKATVYSPPTILFYGGLDPLIPITQGTGMRDRLDLLGVVNAFTLYPNLGHGWGNPELLDTWDKLKVFTEAHL